MGDASKRQHRCGWNDFLELLETRRLLSGVSVVPNVSFAAATLTANESVPSVSINVVLSEPTTVDVTVPFSVTGGTAVSPADYSIAVSPVIIAAGQTSAPIVVTLVNDTLDENNETISIDLGAPTNAVLVTPSSHTLTIADNDAAPTIKFQTNSASVSESAGTYNAVITLSTATSFEVQAQLTIGGTATVGSDFTISSLAVTIPPGQLNTSVTYTIIDDGLVEPSETASLTMTNPVNATLAAPSTFTLTITDNDVPPTVVSSSFEFNVPSPRVHITFSENVSASLDAGDLLLQNHTKLTRVSVSATALSYNAATNTATFTFPGLPNGALTDGNWRARFLGNGITNAAGSVLAADHVLDFFQYAGDINRDRLVNISEFAVLAANFNLPSDFAHGDFNYSGTTDVADFALLAANFNATLAPLAPPTTQYTAVSIPQVPNGGVQPHALSNDGLAVGAVRFPTQGSSSQFQFSGFSWRPGETAVTLNGSAVSATDVTDGGLVIGWQQSASNNDYSALQWTHGTPGVTYLGNPAGNFDDHWAWGVNELQNVVGSHRVEPGQMQNGVRWLAGAGSAETASNKFLTNINNNGEMVGDGPRYYTSAGTSIDIAPGPGLALDVNDSGRVIGLLGSYSLARPTTSAELFESANSIPFTWKNGTGEPFILGPAGTRVHGINNAGQMVGESASGQGIIWHQGIAYALSDFVDGGLAGDGRDINNNGQILTSSRVLTPVPAGEPQRGVVSDGRAARPVAVHDMGTGWMSHNSTFSEVWIEQSDVLQ